MENILRIDKSSVQHSMCLQKEREVNAVKFAKENKIEKKNVGINKTKASGGSLNNIIYALG